MPAPLPAAGSATCSITVSSVAAVEAAVRWARARAVVCLAAGSYAGLDLTGRHTRNVTIQPVPGARVTIGAGVRDYHGALIAVYFEPSASHIVLHGLHITNQVELQAGSSFIRVDHNDITGGWFGVQLDSWNCSRPNAITWPGCQAVPEVTDVIISGNRIHDIGGSTGDDSLNFNNFARVRVTGNEMFGMVEGGKHTDCLETDFGGSNLVFDHNYEHDNNCQGLFPGKSGDVTSVIVYDNLFLRDQIAHEPEANMDIFNVYSLVIRNNTSWAGNVDDLRTQGSAQQPHATVDHNVMQLLSNGCCGDGRYQLTETTNIFQQHAQSFRPVDDRVVSRPRFVAPASDDYRLVNNPKRIGIDWRPAGQHYGPSS